MDNIEHFSDKAYRTITMRISGFIIQNDLVIARRFGSYFFIF